MNKETEALMQELTYLVVSLRKKDYLSEVEQNLLEQTESTIAYLIYLDTRGEVYES